MLLNEDLYFFYLLSALGIIITMFYWYLTKNFNYWSKQGITGPKPVVLFGNLLDRVKNNCAVIDVNYLNTYGKVYGLFEGRSPVLQVADPHLIRIILVQSHDCFINRGDAKTYHPIINKNLFFSRSEDWKRLRRITSSAFSSGKIKKMSWKIRKRIRAYLEHLEDVIKSGQPLDAKKSFQNLTLDILLCCAFATETNASKEPDNIFVVNMRKCFDIKVHRLIPSLMFPKWLNKLLNITSQFDPTANEWILNSSKHIVKQRLNSQNTDINTDFIQLLVNTKADDSIDESIENKRLTEDEIVAQCWIIFIAGFDTSATTLANLAYCLAMNPEYQEILHKEIMTEIGSQKEIGYNEVHRLPYLSACIDETLRLFPPAVRLEREVNQDFKLGDNGINLYEGQLVEIPVYAVHHCEDFFQNAEHFIPERFLPENRNKIIPYTFIPFGMGPRMCIGMKFALMEIKLAMAHILMKYRFIKCDKTEEKIQFMRGISLLHTKSVTLAIQKR